MYAMRRDYTDGWYWLRKVGSKLFTCPREEADSTHTNPQIYSKALQSLTYDDALSRATPLELKSHSCTFPLWYLIPILEAEECSIQLLVRNRKWRKKRSDWLGLARSAGYLCPIGHIREPLTFFLSYSCWLTRIFQLFIQRQINNWSSGLVLLVRSIS